MNASSVPSGHIVRKRRGLKYDFNSSGRPQTRAGRPVQPVRYEPVIPAPSFQRQAMGSTIPPPPPFQHQVGRSRHIKDSRRGEPFLTPPVVGEPRQRLKGVPQVFQPTVISRKSQRAQPEKTRSKSKSSSQTRPEKRRRPIEPKKEVKVEQVPSVEGLTPRQRNLVDVLRKVMLHKQEEEAARMKMKLAYTLDPRPPKYCETGWNASEVIAGFLYIGAGFDRSQQCLIHNRFQMRDAQCPKYEARRQYCAKKGIVYFLNMAGDPKQKELQEIEYPGHEDKDFLDLEEFVKIISVNDVDSWPGKSMELSLNDGAKFIDDCMKINALHRKFGDAKTPAPKLLVHCVAGVNRSAIVVVWWLVKYKKVQLKSAWNMVVERRDIGVGWKNETLGGMVPMKKEIFSLLAKFEKEGKLGALYTTSNSESATANQHLHDTEEMDTDVILDNKLLNDSGETLVTATKDHPMRKYLWYMGLKRMEAAENSK